jgi:membrane-bound lytic murein transglycosylase F
MTISSSTIYQHPQAVNNAIRVLGGLLLCLLPLIMTGSTPPTLLEKVQSDGILQMISVNGPATYYEGAFGHAGFEYDLGKAFADELGVELTILEKNHFNEILNEMHTTDGHFAAAGLSIIDALKKEIDFTIPYATISQKVIYQRDTEKPKTVGDLIGKKIVVIRNSAHANTLRELQIQYPELEWEERKDAEMADMLEMIHNGEADITIVDLTALMTNRVIYPRARPAFTIKASKDIAWAFPKQGDKSLLNAANAFLERYIAEGEVDKLFAKYFNQPSVDESNALAFVERIEERLPKWMPLFQETAKKHELDWLFLAAMSYQESLWNQDAKSHTGVRGLMMLTNQTAKELGIEDRTDPEQSILGGAKYFVSLRERIPKDILEPDRTWMTLAAYNIGLGHLEDARVITQKQGGNPDLWDDVKKRLPLLSNRKYFRNTRHGYARGWEPVDYVKKIRTYYKILIWHFENKRRQIASEVDGKLPNTPIKKSNSTMSQL